MQKRTIDNLLKKGKLSGEKVGRLALQEYIRILNKESQILSETEKQQLIKSLISNEDRKAYNGYIELCSILYTFTVMAEVQSLKVERTIWKISTIMSIYTIYELEGHINIDELFTVDNHELHNKAIETIKKGIKEFYFYSDIISAITSLVGMEYKEIREKEDDILGALSFLNIFVSSNNKLNSIDIEALKPAGENREKLMKHLKAMSPIEYKNMSEVTLYNLFLGFSKNEELEPIAE